MGSPSDGLLTNNNEHNLGRTENLLCCLWDIDVTLGTTHNTASVVSLLYPWT